MSNAAIRRMYADIKQVQEAELEKDGIYCSFNEEDLFDVKAMVVGPEDTPYAFGYYLFHLKFPKNYPYSPPKVCFETRFNTDLSMLRFNPNLYANGKVCLSILGTWHGPQWEPCQSLYSILIAFQTLLVKEPLTNEPGFSKILPEQLHKHQTYKKMVTFENFRVGILHVMNKPPTGFQDFVPIMKQLTYKHMDNIESRLQKEFADHPQATLYTCSVYPQFTTRIDYAEVLKAFQLVKVSLQETYGAVVQKHSMETVTQAENTPTPPSSLNETMSSVDAEVNEAVEAFASASVSATKPKRLKRKRPEYMAKTQPYQVVQVKQPDGNTCTFQSMPSEYVYKRGEQAPQKKTRWLWKQITASNPSVQAPDSSTDSMVL